jgi:cobalt-zinc-cadmium efflux system protein
MTHAHDHHSPGAADDGLTLGAVNERRAQRLWWALGLNLVVVVGQVVAGFAANSLGLLSDAGHNLTDVIALATSLFAVRWAVRPANARRSFGHHRGTVLAALANAGSILAITVLIVYEAINRLLEPQTVDGGIVVVVALGAAVCNGLAMLILREGPPHRHERGGSAGHAHGRGDLNMRSAVLHMAGDALASIGVAIAGLVILVTGGYEWLDPAVSIVIAVLIAAQAVRLFREAVDVLLESTPADLSVEALSTFIEEQPDVESVHDLHVWSLSSEVRALSAHVVLAGSPTLEAAQHVGDTVKAAIAERFAIAHATLELESDACAEDPTCSIDEKTSTTQVRHRG